MELSKSEKQQYNRHLILDSIGLEGQLKLKAVKVLVIGAGGLGCPVLQYLTAAGVGTIGIIDNDTVDISNLQRQILFTHQDIGLSKVKVAIKKLKNLNPYIKFNAHLTQLNTDNAVSLFNQYDIIVDGSDNFPTRYLSNDAAIITKKPLVFAAIYKFEGQVSVFNYQNGPTYRCLFPDPPKPYEVPNCSKVGVLGILPGIIGAIQGNEVLKIVLKIGEVLSGKLLTYNTLSNTQYTIEFNKNTDLIITELLVDYAMFCGIEKYADELIIKDIKNELGDYFLVDVRENWEHKEHNIGGIQISVHAILNRINDLPEDKPILFYCETGRRSRIAKSLVLEKKPTLMILVLDGGIE